MPTCDIIGCTHRSFRPSKSQKEKEKVSKITFHRFPRDPIRLEKWLHAIKRVGWNPTSKNVICSEHFLEKYFDKTSLTCVRLRENAVPTIFKNKYQLLDFKYAPNLKPSSEMSKQELATSSDENVVPVINAVPTNFENQYQLLDIKCESNATSSDENVIPAINVVPTNFENQYEILGIKCEPDSKSVSKQELSTSSDKNAEPTILEKLLDSKYASNKTTILVIKQELSTSSNGNAISTINAVPPNFENQHQLLDSKCRPNLEPVLETSKQKLSISSNKNSEPTILEKLLYSTYVSNLKPSLKIPQQNPLTLSGIEPKKPPNVIDLINDKILEIAHNCSPTSSHVANNQPLINNVHISESNELNNTRNVSKTSLSTDIKAPCEMSPLNEVFIKTIKEMKIRHRNKIRTLQQSNRRHSKKIATLNNELSSLKNNKTAPKHIDIFESMSKNINVQILKRQISKKNGSVPREYSDEIKQFSRTLHSLSPAAYNFVRESFNSCLPHQKRVSKLQLN